MPYNVEPDWTLVEAVVALNFYAFIRVFWWHLDNCDFIVVILFNQKRINNRLSAEWTCYIVFQKSIVAGLVHRMAATHEYSWLSWTVQVAHAYRAIVICSFVLALMIVFHWFSHAAAAVFAVEKIFFASNSTNTAFFAVIDLFLLTFVVIKVANATEIFCKLYLAVFILTLVWYRLFTLTSQAFDIFDSSSVELVIFLWIHFFFIANFIMAETTRPKLSSANGIRTLLLT